jgi:hypothetical protein
MTDHDSSRPPSPPRQGKNHDPDPTRADGPETDPPLDRSSSFPGGGDDTDHKIRSILRGGRFGAVHDVDLLGGVQRRIRERSRGRFYRDGWSRSAAASTHVVTSIIMLVILLLVYFVLLPGVRFR